MFGMIMARVKIRSSFWMEILCYYIAANDDDDDDGGGDGRRNIWDYVVYSNIALKNEEDYVFILIFSCACL